MSVHCFRHPLSSLDYNKYFILVITIIIVESPLIVSNSNLNYKCIEVKSTRETKTRGSEPKGTKPHYLWPPGNWFIGFVSDDPPVTNRFVKQDTLCAHFDLTRTTFVSWRENCITCLVYHTKRKKVEEEETKQKKIYIHI